MPNINIESDFVKLVNERVFNNLGYIIHIDINEDFRNNINHKFSFLKELLKGNELKIHFVDHALLTGESLRITKSYLSSILCSELSFNRFDSIITLINRLSFEKNKEIIGYDTNEDYIYSYVNLFIPPVKNPEEDCNLCKIINHYNNNIIKNSSLESCQLKAIDKIESLN